MKKIISFFLLGILSLLFLQTGCGKKTSKHLTVVMESSFPPYEFYSNGKLTGIDPEIMAVIARDLGRHLEIIDCSFDYLLQSVAEGKYDIAASAISITEERKKIVDFTIPYAEGRLVGVLPLQSDIRKPADMKNRLIGVQSGSTSCEFVRKNIQEPTTFPHIALAAEALSAGKLDAIVLDEQPARIIVKNNRSLKLMPLPLHVEQYAFAIRKGQPELLKQLNDSISRMKRRGFIIRISEKYRQLLAAGKNHSPLTQKFLRVAVDPTFPPYTDLEQDGPAGIEIDIMHRIADELGCKVLFEQVGRDSLLRVVATENGIDMGIAALPLSAVKEDSVSFSIPHSEVSQRFVVLQDSPVRSAKDLKEKRIGTLFNSLAEEYVRRHHAEPECFSDVSLMLHKLKEKKLDSIVLENFSALLLQSQDPSLRVLKDQFLKEKYVIAINKNNHVLLQQVNQLLQRMLTDGTMEELRHRHSRTQLLKKGSEKK